MPAIVMITDPPISVILWRNTVRVWNRGRPPIGLLSILGMRNTMVTIGPLASQSGDDDEYELIIRRPISLTSGKSTQRWLYSGCLGSLPPHLQSLDIGSILNMISQKNKGSRLKNHLGVHFGRNYPPKKFCSMPSLSSILFSRPGLILLMCLEEVRAAATRLSGRPRVEL